MKNWKLLILLVLTFAFSGLINAQTGLTSLRGTVTDPSKAVAPGAEVEIKNPASGFHASTKTDSNGAYEFLQIPPGRYTVTATMTGFAIQTKEAELLVSQPVPSILPCLFRSPSRRSRSVPRLKP